MIVKIRYAVIILFYFSIGLIPTIIFFDKVCDECEIFLVMIMLLIWVFGLLLTPWTYYKIFKNK